MMSLVAALLLVLGDGGKSHGTAALAMSILLIAVGIHLWGGRVGRSLQHPAAPGVGLWLVWTVGSWIVHGGEPASIWPLLKMGSAVAFAVVWMDSETEGDRRRFETAVIGLGGLAALSSLRAALAGPEVRRLISGNPQYEAFLMVVAALLALASALRGDVGRLRRVSLTLLGLIFAAAIVMTGSRAALIAVSVGAGVECFRRWGRRGVLVFAASAALALALVPRGWVDRWIKSTDPLSWKRTDIWTGALLGAADRPVMGWGPGRYALADNARRVPQERRPVRYGMETTFAHNDFLQVAVETGIPALLFVLFAVGATLVRGGRDPSVGGFSAMIGGLVFLLFNFPLTAPLCAVVFAGLAAERPAGPMPHAWGISPESGRRLGRVAALSAVGAAGVALVLALGGVRWPHGNRTPPSGANPLFPLGLLAGADRALHPTGGEAADVPEARRLLERALRWDPRSPHAWRDMAHLRADHEPSVSALEDASSRIQRALALHPTQAIWWLEAAGIYGRQGNLEGAREACHRALVLEPRFGAAALSLGRVLRAKGETELARRWLEGWRRHTPVNVSGSDGYARAILERDEDGFHEELAQVHLQAGRWADAEREIEEISDRRREDREILRIAVRWASGRRDEARRFFRSAWARGPRSAALKIAGERLGLRP
jgi:Tfp pilus assembly protein PilF